MKEKCIFKNPKIAMVILIMALMIAGALNVYSASFAMMGYGKGISAAISQDIFSLGSSACF